MLNLYVKSVDIYTLSSFCADAVNALAGRKGDCMRLIRIKHEPHAVAGCGNRCSGGERVTAVRAQTRWFIVGVPLFMAWAFANMDKFGIAIVATDRDFLRSFGLLGHRAGIGLLLSSFTFAYAVATFGWGFVIDRLGPRKVTITSATIWALMMALPPIAASYGVLLVSRVILGLAEGALWAVSAKLLANWFAIGERARATAFPGYGQVAGPAVVGVLIVSMIFLGGWQLSFYVLAALNLLVIVPVFLFVVRDAPEQHPRISPSELRYIKAGRKITKLKDGTTSEDWLATLRDPRFWLIALAFTVTPFAFFALTTWVPSYLVDVRHFSKGAMGAWLSAGYLVAIGELLVATALADYLRWPGLIGGIGLAVAGVNLIIGIQAPNPNVAAILITTGQGGCLVADMMVLTIIQRTFLPAMLGRVTGSAKAIGSIGGILSPTLLGWMLDLGKGDYTPSLTLVAFVLLVGAAVFVAVLGTRTKVGELQVVGV